VRGREQKDLQRTSQPTHMSCDTTTSLARVACPQQLQDKRRIGDDRRTDVQEGVPVAT
jgi:hypothetical protein